MPTHEANRLTIAGRSGSRRVVIWGLLSTLLFAALYIFKPTLLQPLDQINYDLLLRNFPDNHPNSRLVIVDLDEKSLERYGQWPWPRYRVAELLAKIAAVKPAAIGLDVLFAEPDRTSAGRLLQDLGDAYKLHLAIDHLPGALRDNDLILAATLAKGPFVLGNKFHFDRREKSSPACVLHPVRVSVLQNTGAPQADQGIPEGVGASGFVNVSPDQDGMLRRLPLLIRYQGETYASLALATVLQVKAADNLLLKKEGNTLQSLNFKGTAVPVDPHGQLLIKFRGPSRSYDYLPAAEIMAGKVTAERLRGRIVLVGTSASGLKELRATPFDPNFPGVEVQATVIDNLLTGDFISVPSWTTGLVLLLVVVMGMATTLLIAFSRAAACFLVMLLACAGTWLVSQQVFFHLGVFVGTAAPIAAVVGNYLLLTVLKYRLEEKQILAGMRELLLTQDTTIESLANLAEYRDLETGGHIKRTRRYVKLLAERLRRHERYKHFLSDANIDLLYKSAPLHDIGKVGIPDNILLKPSPLSEEEFAVMKTHTTIGRDVIESSIRSLGRESFLRIAAEMAYSHQEKWDGSGYPLGLKGEAIPISGRLMALADFYDALVSRRAYKSPTPHAAAVAIIEKSRGTHFDPDLVDAFLASQEQFRTIAREFADSPEEREALAGEPPHWVAGGKR
jgi:adenylate cyclase